MDLHRVRFEPVVPEHMSLIEPWLREAHVRRWWGDPAEQSALVRSDMDEPLMDGYLVHVDGAPVGYIQTFPANAWPGHPFGVLAKGAFAVDMFLGEPRRLGQGLGALALRAMAERLLIAGASRVLIDPAPDNIQAIAAYRRAGFKEHETADGADGPVLVMSFERATP